MSGRRNYHFRQKVQEDELDVGFALLEEAQWNYAVDNGTFGIVEGLEASEKSGTPNLTIDVAKGAAYDQTGRRVAQPALSENVDVSQDSNASSTTVASGGNEKWVSVFIVFDRLLDDVREDGNGDPIYFVEDEAYEFVVVQGAEASIGAAVRPSLLSNGLLVVDINRTNGQTQIFNADIFTNRTQHAFLVEGAYLEIRQGKATDAIADIVDAYNAHIDGSGDQHLATDMLYGGGAAWLDGTTNPAGTMEDTIDALIVGLKSTVSTTSGSNKLGSASLVGSLSTIVAGTIHSQLLALKAATAIEWAGGPTWASLESNGAQSASSALSSIISSLASTNALTSGLDRIGARAMTTWLGGRTNPANSGYGAINKIITDLAVTTASDDGMERIGGQAVAGSPYSLTEGSARSQATELLAHANANAADIATNTSDIAAIEALVYQHPTPSTSASPSYSNGTASFSSITSMLFGSPVAEQVEVDDVIEIRFVCTAASSIVYSLIALFVQQPSDGSPVEITGTRVRVPIGSGGGMCIVATHTVTEAGDLAIYARGRPFDGTGTLTMNEGYRLEATRFRPAS
jgi:hypothetical protein